MRFLDSRVARENFYVDWKLQKKRTREGLGKGGKLEGIRESEITNVSVVAKAHSLRRWLLLQVITDGKYEM